MGHSTTSSVLLWRYRAFSSRNEELSPAVRRHLLEIFDDHQDFQDLCLELAAVVDAGVHFVSATYYLEGDTPLIFTCYERLCSVASAVAVEHYPNTTAIDLCQLTVTTSRRTMFIP